MGTPAIVALALSIFWIISITKASIEAVDYYNKPKEKFCKKVCEGEDFDISFNKCICFNGQEYDIEIK